MWASFPTSVYLLLQTNGEIFLLNKKIFLLTFVKRNISLKYDILFFYLIKPFVDF